MADAMAARSPDPRRFVGTVAGSRPGPTVVLTGGIHGNEPAGVTAVERVIAQLDPKQLRGRVVGLRGNLAAMDEDRRYLRRDLNREWSEATLERLRRQPIEALEAEDLEQRELYDIFRGLMIEAEGPVCFLDLHTMSGPGQPFACMADVLRNRRVAFALPVTVVLGLEEVIEGSMLGFLCDLGHIGVAVEGGQHHDLDSVNRLEAATWLTLVATGALESSAVPRGYEAHRVELERASDGLPAVVEIKHRHVCRDDDDFEMMPGLRSFQHVRKGQHLALDRRGDIRSPYQGLLLLPRYQGSGSDGFFVAREVRKVWLGLSAGLRRVRADRVLVRLPGVEPHPTRAETYLVDPRIARFLVVEIFHLFGYRRIQPEGPRLAFSRRRPDGRITALPAGSR